MKLKKISLSFIAIVMFILFLTPNADASQLNFSATPVIPEKTQVDKTKTYYDLKLDAGAKEELAVTLKNHTKKDVTVETSLNRATTNINGIVEYGNNANKANDSLLYDIEKIATVKTPEITVKPNEEKTVIIEVNMPKEKFEGVLASGLTFKEKNASEDKKEEEQGLSIKNEYAYVVALLLHGDIPQKDIESELQLGDVKADQVNVRNVITANLKNVKPKYVNKMIIDADIYKKGSTEKLYSLKKENLQMAPNSNFNYGIPLDGDKLKAGTYLLKMKVNSSSGEWEFEKEFTVSKEEAKKYNEQDVTIKEDYTLYYVIGGIVLLILIQIIVTIIVKKSKKKSNSKRKKKNKSNRKKSRK